MATYQELLTASEDSDLRNKLRVAVVVAAETVRTELTSVPNHANRLIWAKKVFTNPDAEVLPMLWATLAANRANSLAQILGASDAVVQTAVDAAVDVLAQG